MQKNLQSLLLLFCFAGTDALAQNTSDTYIDLMPVVSRVDRDRGTDNPAYGARAILGYGTTGPWYIEGQLFGIRADAETPFSGSNFYTTGLGLDAVHMFSSRQSYTPFVLVGVGASNNNARPGDSDVNGFINLGAGFVSAPLNDSGLKLRAEVRYLHDYFSTDMNDWQLGVGFSFPLSTPTPPAAAPVAVAAPAPAPEPPRDSDGDGVFDDQDRCPNTLPGTKVDRDGCAIADQTITLENIQFEYDSAKLTRNAETALNKVVQALDSQASSQVEVAGHTDSRGNDNYNLRLSDQRANSVRQYLVTHGISAARITSKGYGEQQPVASNDTEAGRAKNRRVELRFR